MVIEWYGGKYPFFSFIQLKDSLHGSVINLVSLDILFYRFWSWSDYSLIFSTKNHFLEIKYRYFIRFWMSQNKWSFTILGINCCYRVLSRWLLHFLYLFNCQRHRLIHDICYFEVLFHPTRKGHTIFFFFLWHKKSLLLIDVGNISQKWYSFSQIFVHHFNWKKKKWRSL